MQSLLSMIALSNSSDFLADCCCTFNPGFGVLRAHYI